MYSKSLLIAIAAFAVTTSGAQAFMGINYVERAGLTARQTEAFTQARGLRSQGKTEAARDVLLAAGIDEKAVASIRQAAREAHKAVEKAIAEKDFAAFQLAVAGTPIADIITTKADFIQFSEASALKKVGQHQEARDIFSELGITGQGRYFSRDDERHQARIATLTPSQLDAYEVAKQANDRRTMQQILREAGIEPRLKHANRSTE